MYLFTVEAFVVVVDIVVVIVVAVVVLLIVVCYKTNAFITLALDTYLNVKETLILCSRDSYEEPKL